MKKKLLTLLLLLIIHNHLDAQSSESKSYIGNINEMFPAAPTSNNLMKFEEVPVSYYTGIPHINIPLLNIPTNNKNVNINVQLKYHTLNNKPDDRAGETGLGWSLIAGGTITRTVRGGGPDEKDRTIAFSIPPKNKFGIYNHVYNPTYKIINNDSSFDFNNYTFDAGIGKFDTEYDLYQYNFMDKSGRFFVVKKPDGGFIVEKLDKNNLQITCQYNSIDVITSFTIIDDKGIKYIFNAMETSQKEITNIKKGLITGTGDIIPNLEIGDYYTAFHLKQINDQNNISLAEFKYDLLSEVKFQDTPTTTSRIPKDVNYVNNTNPRENIDHAIPGAFERQFIYTTSQTNLLTEINIRGKKVISFHYEKGRQDSNYSEPGNLYQLKSIQTNYLRPNASEYTDKYVFDYSYTNTNCQMYNGNQLLQKMLLKKVSKISTNQQNAEYVLEYNENSSLLKKDYWGYYKALAPASNNDITTDVIKSITYPTKGKVIFNFEENEYSYHPTATDIMVPVTGQSVTNNFDSSINFSQFNNSYKQHFFSIQSPQNVNLDLFLGNLIYCNWQFRIYRKNQDGTFSSPVYEFSYSAQTCNLSEPSGCMVLNPNPNGEIISEFHPSVYLQPGIYYASLSGDFGFSDPVQTADTFVSHTVETTYTDAKVYKGGGIRIKNIIYFDNDAQNSLLKKSTYNYDNLEDPQRSSGALVFPEPVFEIKDYYTFKNKYYNPSIQYSAQFDITTDYNILPVQKTQGADVGYKHIVVEQTDKNDHKKGKTVYEFRSPIDFPNDATVIPAIPSIPIPNQDYLRGQLISEKKYDSNNMLLSENTTDYSSSDYQKNDGIKIKDNYSNNTISELYSFYDFQHMVSQIGAPIQLTTPYKNFEKFGITLPIKKNEKLYFYKNGIQTFVGTTTHNTYNSNDYPISIRKDFQDGSTYVTNYKYSTEKGNQRLINANMIANALETELKKNNTVINKEEVNYDDPSHFSPSSVLSYTAPNNTPVSEVKYEKYDLYGNLLQYTSKEKIPTAMIWGYNQTQPIAKIEGATYDQVISSGLTSAIISASDSDAANPSQESVFIAALDSFRTHPSLSSFQITTYTYDPLVGVTSITPPSGIREVYIYDTANRLKEIRQDSATGKVLKTFKYNYKN